MTLPIQLLHPVPTPPPEPKRVRFKIIPGKEQPKKIPSLLKKHIEHLKNVHRPSLTTFNDFQTRALTPYRPLPSAIPRRPLITPKTKPPARRIILLPQVIPEKFKCYLEPPYRGM